MVISAKQPVFVAWEIISTVSGDKLHEEINGMALL
jgi:hypothetical protein